MCVWRSTRLEWTYRALRIAGNLLLPLVLAFLLLLQLVLLVVLGLLGALLGVYVSSRVSACVYMLRPAFRAVSDSPLGLD